MPRLFRQSPLNANWEGSGNVIALHILRAAAREPDSVAAVMAELDNPVGMNARYDRHVAGIKRFLSVGSLNEGGARAFAQSLGLGLQAAALSWSAPAPVFEGFCAQRLDAARRGFLYGDLTHLYQERSRWGADLAGRSRFWCCKGLIGRVLGGLEAEVVP